MLSEHKNEKGVASPRASHEVMQQIVLAGLYRGGFFDHAAFYGGTCLRIFHALPRFSKRMCWALSTTLMNSTSGVTIISFNLPIESNLYNYGKQHFI